MKSKGAEHQENPHSLIQALLYIDQYNSTIKTTFGTA